jgi:hypothetical protein
MTTFTMEEIQIELLKDLSTYDPNDNYDYNIAFEDKLKFKFSDFVNKNDQFSRLLLHQLEITNFISNDKYLEIDEMIEIIPQIDELLKEKEIQNDLEMFSVLIELKTYLRCAISLNQRVFVFSE